MLLHTLPFFFVTSHPPSLSSCPAGHTDLLGQIQSSLGLWQASTASSGGGGGGGAGAGQRRPASAHRATISQPILPLSTTTRRTVTSAPPVSPRTVASTAQVPPRPPLLAQPQSLEEAAEAALVMETPPPSPTAPTLPMRAASAVGSRRRVISDVSAVSGGVWAHALPSLAGGEVQPSGPASSSATTATAPISAAPTAAAPAPPPAHQRHRDRLQAGLDVHGAGTGGSSSTGTSQHHHAHSLTPVAEEEGSEPP